MKTKTVFSLVSLLVVSLSHPAWARGGGGGGFGGGAHFGGGGGGVHFGGGGGFHSAPAFHGGGFWRTSLLVRRAADLRTARLRAPAKSDRKIDNSCTRV